MRIPLASPDIGDSEIEAVREVLDDGRLALGPKLREFERALATYVGADCAVAVNSGTSALHLVLEGFGIGEGDEVITTPFSFVASANCVHFVRARLVFADIDPGTLCIDPAAVESAISLKTKAILGVDVFGHPADWPALEEIAARYELLLIEDSAESLGSVQSGRRCGSFGHAAVFGFYPNKQITTGEGGMVVTGDRELERICRSMANQGRGDGDDWLEHVRLGYNYRMDELSAALGVAQMGRIGEILEARGSVASLYDEALSGIEGILTPRAVGDVGVSWFVYVIRLDDAFERADRDRVIRGLTERGIGCRNYFAPIHLQPFYRDRFGTREGEYPVAEAAGARTIALPFHNRLSENEIDYVASALREELGRIR